MPYLLYLLADISQQWCQEGDIVFSLLYSPLTIVLKAIEKNLKNSAVEEQPSSFSWWVDSCSPEFLCSERRWRVAPGGAAEGDYGGALGRVRNLGFILRAVRGLGGLYAGWCDLDGCHGAALGRMHCTEQERKRGPVRGHRGGSPERWQWPGSECWRQRLRPCYKQKPLRLPYMLSVRSSQLMTLLLNSIK